MDIRKQPTFSDEDAEFIVKKHFGIEGQATSLPSERDQNFKINSNSGKYVLKIAHPDSEIDVLKLENQAIRLAEAVTSFNSAQLLKSKDGQSITELSSNEQIWFVRCLGFVPGIPLAEVAQPSNSILQQIGASLGELGIALSALNQNQAAKRDLKWDLKCSAEIVDESFNQFKDKNQSQLLELFLDRFRAIESRVSKLPESVIHNDANDYNIMFDAENEFAQIGLIDFGDMLHSKTIYDLAICVAYVILDKPDPLEIACHVIRGYHSARKICEPEVSVLFELICMRLAQSVCIANQQKTTST